jgi:hypothetical protein
MVEYILCYSGPVEHWGPLPDTRLASRKILIEQNIKKRTGPALCVLCALSLLPLWGGEGIKYSKCTYIYILQVHILELLMLPWEATALFLVKIKIVLTKQSSESIA